MKKFNSKYIINMKGMIVIVKLPAIFSDGMIIEKNAKIWGEAEAGESVILTFLGKTYKTVADENGCFSIDFFANEFGGPHELTINGTVIRDILVGYVWLCGGQSNMELPILRVRRMFEDELKNINIPDIRAFNVRKAYDFNNEQQLYEGEWLRADENKINDFYAVAFFFANNIYKTYGIPVGLICCAAGGSAAESWISAETLKQFPRINEVLSECMNPEYVRETENSGMRNMHDWYTALDTKDTGKKEGWDSEGYDDTEWCERKLTESWYRDLNINGSVWFRKTVDLPPEMDGIPAVLHLGRVVDSNFVYVNGEFVGRIEYQYPPSIFKLRKGLLRKGKNTISVRVISNYGLGGFIKDKPYKIESEYGEVDLSGNWKYRIGCVMDYMPGGVFFYSKPAGLYNAMLAPVIGYPVTGAIWYQGESNTHYPEDYFELMSALIKEWREKWRQNFPFIFTQLANFEANSAKFPDSLWASLREKQLECLAIPKTAMASAIDCGEYNDLHPLDKKTVGERLAIAARAIAYGEDLVYSGPIAKNAVYDNNKITINFDHTGSGLTVKNGGLELFEIETEYGGCFKAKACINNNNVIVYCDKALSPKYIRYAWADNPTANLYNLEGLPASPFRIKLVD